MFSQVETWLKGHFPLDEFLRAKRLFLLSHELSAGTNDGSIQFEQWKVDSPDKSRLVENGLKTRRRLYSKSILKYFAYS